MYGNRFYFRRRAIIELEYFTTINIYFHFVFQHTCLTFIEYVPPSKQFIHTIGRKNYKTVHTSSGQLRVKNSTLRRFFLDRSRFEAQTNWSVVYGHSKQRWINRPVTNNCVLLLFAPHCYCRSMWGFVFWVDFFWSSCILATFTHDL